MYVCICNNVTDKQIAQAVDEGVGNMRELREHLGVASQCGKCARQAKRLIQENQIGDTALALIPSLAIA